MELARAEYEACLEKQRLECERLRREQILAESIARAQAAQTAQTAATPPGGATTPRGGSTPTSTAPPPAASYPAYESVPVQRAPYCHWVRYNVPYGDTANNVRVVATGRRDTPSAIEVRQMDSGTRSQGKGFEFHCKATSGTALILFEVVSGDVHRYKMRVGCTIPE